MADDKPQDMERKVRTLLSSNPKVGAIGTPMYMVHGPLKECLEKNDNPNPYKQFIPTEEIRRLIEDQQREGPVNKFSYSLKDSLVDKDDPHYCKPLQGGISVALSGDMQKVMSELATAQGITPTEMLRKAIVTEQYLYEEKQKGAIVLLRYPNGEVREVIFR